MASGKYQHSAYFPCTIELSSHLRNRLSSLWRQSLFAGEKVFSPPFPFPIAVLLPPREINAGSGWYRRRLSPRSLRQEVGDQTNITRDSAKSPCSIFHIRVKKKRRFYALAQSAADTREGPGIDNSIKFMFIERVPRGQLQPIAERFQS